MHLLIGEVSPKRIFVLLIDDSERTIFLLLLQEVAICVQRLHSRLLEDYATTVLLIERTIGLPLPDSESGHLQICSLRSVWVLCPQGCNLRLRPKYAFSIGKTGLLGISVLLAQVRTLQVCQQLLLLLLEPSR